MRLTASVARYGFPGRYSSPFISQLLDPFSGLCDCHRDRGGECVCNKRISPVIFLLTRFSCLRGLWEVTHAIFVSVVSAFLACLVMLQLWIMQIVCAVPVMQ